MSAKPPARRWRTTKPLTRERREKLLEHLRQGRTLTSAAKAVGSDRRRVYELAQRDEDFRRALEEARDEGVDALEDALVRAAIEGWQEQDVVEKSGQVVSRITKHRRDPRLLAKVREWRRPPVSVEVTADAGPLEVEGRPVVGWADLLAVAREAGAAHLLGLPMPEGARGGESAADGDEVIDAEAVEVPHDDEAEREHADSAPPTPRAERRESRCVRAPSSTGTAADPPTPDPADLPTPSEPRNLTLQEWADCLTFNETGKEPGAGWP